MKQTENPALSMISSEFLSSADQAEPSDMLFFWGHRPSKDGQIIKSCLSQWWQCQFLLEGDLYSSAEQYMMAEKARLFEDDACRKKILATSDPKGVKAFGRQVTGYDDLVWCRKRYQIVVEGNKTKFAQNEHLQSFLLGTGEKTLVEASPADPIWGVGLAEDNPKITDPKKWKGLNLLGYALMEVRKHLQESGQ